MWTDYRCVLDIEFSGCVVVLDVKSNENKEIKDASYSVFSLGDWLESGIIKLGETGIGAGLEENHDMNMLDLRCLLDLQWVSWVGSWINRLQSWWCMVYKLYLNHGLGEISQGETERRERTESWRTQKCRGWAKKKECVKEMKRIHQWGKTKIRRKWSQKPRGQSVSGQKEWPTVSQCWWEVMQDKDRVVTIGLVTWSSLTLLTKAGFEAWCGKKSGWNRLKRECRECTAECTDEDVEKPM